MSWGDEKIKRARNPTILLKLARALVWAWWHGYRPIPGYTVCELEENGDLYLAIQMTKDGR